MSVKNKTKEVRRKQREQHVPNYQSLPLLDVRNSREAVEKVLKSGNLPQSKYFLPSDSVIGLSYNLGKQELQAFRAIFMGIKNNKDVES